MEYYCIFVLFYQEFNDTFIQTVKTGIPKTHDYEANDEMPDVLYHSSTISNSFGAYI